MEQEEEDNYGGASNLVQQSKKQRTKLAKQNRTLDCRKLSNSMQVAQMMMSNSMAESGFHN
jgi:hypothetical protein